MYILSAATEFEDFDPTEKGDLDDRSTQEIFEDKLKEAIDGVLEKRYGRLSSIQLISNITSDNFNNPNP